MFKRSSSRGSSILAALVFVGILGAVVYGVQAFSPSANRQALAAQAAGATSKEKAIQLKGSSRCNAPIEVKKDKKAKGALDGVGGVTNVCVPGCEYKVQKDTGSIDAKDPCADFRTGTAAQNVAKASCEKARRCAVEICSGPGKCDSPLTGSAAESALGRAAQIPEYFKTDQEILDAINKARAGGDPAADLSKLPSWYQDAFKEAKTDSQKELDDRLLANQSKQDDTEKRLNNLINAGADDGVIASMQKAKEQLQQQQQALLQERSNLLARDITALKPDESKAPVNKDQKTIYPGDYQGEDPAAIDKALGTSGVAPQPGCNSDKSVCYAVSQKDIEALNSKDYVCTAAGDYSMCTKKGTLPPWTGKNSSAPPCNIGNCNGSGGGGKEAPPEKTNNGGLGSLGSLLQQLMKGLTGAGGPLGAQGQACSSDPNAYQQQQQQYNQQLQQYNYQLQQYNYQQQMSAYNGVPAPVTPVAPSPCQQNLSQNTCAAASAQPAASGCSNGTWKPVTTQQSNGVSCTTSWQCVPGGGNGATPTAQLSCNPQIADVGMSIAIAYSCANATGSTGSGFDTGGATSGATSTIIANPPAGANIANFGLTCNNQGLISQAQCSVQIGRPSIVLVANPKVVPSGASSTIGWITSGMKTCVVSSPDLSAFTAANASNTSVNGSAPTPALTADTGILLHCVSVGGGTRDATTTIQIATSTTP